MEDNKKQKPGDDNHELNRLTVMGDTYLTRLTGKYMKRQPWTKPNEMEIISFIPGTVREILVKEGDTVEINQKVLILEAMKMMNTITAPVAGKIKSVKVNVGDCVPKGKIMIELE